MKKYLYILLISPIFSLAQVGINTTTPNAQLEIKSSNQATPANTDGILIPKINTFPAVNPTAAQQGMMVYLTTTAGTRTPGFYYWDNATTSWIGVGSNTANAWGLNGNTGTTAGTNFIGTTDNQDVVFKRFNVTSGRITTDNTSFGNNALATNSGFALTAIGLNALQSNTNGYDNTAVGTNALRLNTTGVNNTAVGKDALSANVVGFNNTAFGTNALRLSTNTNNTAFGFGALQSVVTGFDNTAFGSGALASNTNTQNAAFGVNSLFNNTSGGNNAALGSFSLISNTTGLSNTGVGDRSLITNTTGSSNTGLGFRADVATGSLINATAIGANAQVAASNSIVLGSINGVNLATADTRVGIGTTTPQDKLHVVGNIRMVDGNQSAGKVLTSDANGTATWQTPAVAGTTLDSAYDFGGTGAGRTIIADAGAVTIAGTDGFVSTGTELTGAIPPSGAGTRMVWNPRKAAFRAGTVIGTKWDDVSIGFYSTAFGYDTTASGLGSTASGSNSTAGGGSSTALGSYVTASGLVSTAFGANAVASGSFSTAFGFYPAAIGYASTAYGNRTFALGKSSTAFGQENTAFSYGEVVLGLGATSYTPSTNGDTQFGLANATDRLFVVGNAIDANNNSIVDSGERSDALVILKNGNTGIGSSTPQDKLHVLGNIRMVDGNQAAGKVLTSDANGTATWQNASANTWGLTGNTGTNSAINFIGTSDNQDLVFKRNNILAGILAFNNTAFGINAFLSNTTGANNTAIGRSALESNNSGFGNTAVGISAGFSITTGQYNTAVGSNSLNGVTTGDFNTVLGALSRITTNNLTNAIAIGAKSEVGANNSMVLGSINGVNGATSSVNVGIGTTTPSDRLHVVGNIRMVDGNQGTGKVLTSDANGTATWQNASANAWGLTGNAGTSSATNFIGTTDSQSLRFRTANTFSGNISNTATGLVSLGLNAGPNNTGISNTFFGGSAGLGNTSGNRNTFIGQGAGAANTTNSQNTYIGTDAGANNATGDRNVYIGSGAGRDGTGGSDNILIGLGAGLSNTASNNVMIGSFAGNGNGSGGGNVFLGGNAGGNNVTGGQNTFIGLSAGFINSSGSRNTIIGNSATLNTGFLINATAIGYRSQVDVNDGLVLGSVNGINGATSTSLVGIGTSSPADRLHVVGNIRMVDGNQAVGKVLTSDANGTATWQNASANAWGLSGNTGTSAATNYLGTTDDVDVILRRFNIRAGRIGTNNTSLGVNALNTTATGTSNTAIGVDALKSATTGTNNTAIGQNALGIINSGTYNTAIGSEASTSSTLLTNATAIGSRSLAGANNVMVLGSINGVNGATSSVNVGIGTTTPSARLEIVDENAVTAAITRGNLHVMTNNPQALDIGGAITLGGYSDDAASATRVFASVEGRKSTATSGTSSGYLQFKTNNAGTLTERVRITNTGNVGVGTATPGGQFELSLDQGRKPGTTTWTVTSDERLKDISGDYTFGLEAIKQLKPIRYHYKNIGDRSFDPKILATEFSGFSAQEVQKVFPNCVTTDEDGYLSLNIHDIVIASINAIKELDKKNAELQLENEALKRKLQQHDEQLAAILAELQKRQ